MIPLLKGPASLNFACRSSNLRVTSIELYFISLYEARPNSTHLLIRKMLSCSLPLRSSNKKYSSKRPQSSNWDSNLTISWNWINKFKLTKADSGGNIWNSWIASSKLRKSAKNLIDRTSIFRKKSRTKPNSMSSGNSRSRISKKKNLKLYKGFRRSKSRTNNIKSKFNVGSKERVNTSWKSRSQAPN